MKKYLIIDIFVAGVESHDDSQSVSYFMKKYLISLSQGPSLVTTVNQSVIS